MSDGGAFMKPPPVRGSNTQRGLRRDLKKCCGASGTLIFGLKEKTHFSVKLLRGNPYKIKLIIEN